MEVVSEDIEKQDFENMILKHVFKKDDPPVHSSSQNKKSPILHHSVAGPLHIKKSKKKKK